MQQHFEEQHSTGKTVSNEWQSGLNLPYETAVDEVGRVGDAPSATASQMEIAGIVGHEEIVTQPHFEEGVLDDSDVSHPSHELLASSAAADSAGNALIVSGADSSTSLMLLSSFIPGYDFDHQVPEIGTASAVEQVFPIQHQGNLTNSSNIGSFACSMCQKKFSTQKAKNQHERLVHAKVSINYNIHFIFKKTEFPPCLLYRELFILVKYAIALLSTHNI